MNYQSICKRRYFLYQVVKQNLNLLSGIWSKTHENVDNEIQWNRLRKEYNSPFSSKLKNLHIDKIIPL